MLWLPGHAGRLPVADRLLAGGVAVDDMQLPWPSRLTSDGWQNRLLFSENADLDPVGRMAKPPSGSTAMLGLHQIACPRATIPLEAGEAAKRLAVVGDRVAAHRDVAP